MNHEQLEAANVAAARAPSIQRVKDVCAGLLQCERTQLLIRIANAIRLNEEAAAIWLKPRTGSLKADAHLVTVGRAYQATAVLERFFGERDVVPPSKDELGALLMDPIAGLTLANRFLLVATLQREHWNAVEES